MNTWRRRLKILSTQKPSALPLPLESVRWIGIMTKLIIQKYIALPWVRYLVFFGSSSLNSYFSVLHPRHKLNYFKKAGWDDTWVKTAQEIVRAEFDQTYAFMDIETEKPPSIHRTVSLRLQLRSYANLHSFSPLRRLATFLMICLHLLPPWSQIFVMILIAISASIPNM